MHCGSDEGEGVELSESLVSLASFFCLLVCADVLSSCFVRARRLNVIIQPHLRFTYELLKWDETLSERRGVPLKREFEWATVAREIAAMNKPYCRV